MLSNQKLRYKSKCIRIKVDGLVASSSVRPINTHRTIPQYPMIRFDAFLMFIISTIEDQ